MRVRFENLGPVKKTELDVRPLTVIIGPNNSGKTYIAYALYGFIHALREHARAFWWHETNGSIYDLPSKIRASIEIASDRFNEHLSEFFQDRQAAITSETRIVLAESRQELRRVLTACIPSWIHDAETKGIRVRQQGRRLQFPRGVHRDVRHPITFQGLVTADLFTRPFLLPAERNALVITYKLLANRRYRLLRRGVRTFAERRDEAAILRQMEILREQGDIRYPEPIELFLEFLEDVELEASGQTEAAPVDRSFIELADLVETKVQGGHQVFFDKTPLGGRALRVKVPGGPSLDLSLASSSLKQLAPYLLYLRHRAYRRGYLLIDEPEMNLHPETQVRLLESLAILVNLGVNVVLTTHSPYLANHLNNLVKGATGDSEVLAAQARYLYLNDPRAFLRPSQVGVYEMRNFQLTSLLGSDAAVDWDNLGDTFSDLQRRFFEIYEAAHAEREDE